MDVTMYTPNIAYIHNCSDCGVNCERIKSVRKIYWGLFRGTFKNVSEAFQKVTGLQWQGDDFHKCVKHQVDKYIFGSCNNTLCDIMSPTPTQWFEISSTWRMTDFSHCIYKYLNFKPYMSSITTTNIFKPTKVLCIYTGMVVQGAECDAYFTVSHVWSSSNFTMIDGKLSRSSKGYLWLERMSKLLKITHAWIDTCCINQDDMNEKEKEVSRMGDYYRNAQACAVLHSADIKDIDDFVNSIRVLSTNATLFVRPTHAWVLACIRHSKLLTDTWFTRIWTVQEAVLSKRLVVDSSCGLVDLKELLRCYDIIVKKIGGVPMCDDRGTVRMLSEFISINTIDMITILKLCANRQAGFKHDYVYGIIGMLPHIQINVDYIVPMKQVVIQLYRLLIKHGDISWLSWIGSSCIGKRRESWVPTIGSSMMFAMWNNGIALRHNRSLMDIFCSDIRVKILGGSISDEMYTTNFQPIVTLCELSYNTNKCIGCIAEIFCNYGCCRSWMVIKAAKEAQQTDFITCSNCLMQQPSSSYDLCRQHISQTFHRTLGSRLWLTVSTDDMYVLVSTWRSNRRTKASDIKWTEKYLLYGRRVKTVTKYMYARALVSENFGWLVSNTMDRIGVVVACSNVYTMSDEYISV